MVHAGSVNARIFLVCAMECMYTQTVLDLGLYSYPKEFLGLESEPMLTPEKIPSTGCSEEDRTQDTASLRTASPTHYRLSHMYEFQQLEALHSFVR